MSLKIDNKQHRDFKVDSDQSLIATVAIILTNIYIFILYEPDIGDRFT